MKMMRKFSLLVVIALIITVGGVYATWSYMSPGNVRDAEKVLNMHLITYDVVGGSLTSYDNTTIEVIIDDNYTKVQDGEPILNPDHVTDDVEFRGNLIMIFTAGSSDNDETPAEITYYITITPTPSTGHGAWEYDDDTTDSDPAKPIFLQKNNVEQVITKNLKKIDSDNFTTDNGATITGLNGKYYLEISAAEVAARITMNEFSLPTVDAWDAFDSALRNGNLKVNFSVTNPNS